MRSAANGVSFPCSQRGQASRDAVVLFDKGVREFFQHEGRAFQQEIRATLVSRAYFSLHASEKKSRGCLIPIMPATTSSSSRRQARFARKVADEPHHVAAFRATHDRRFRGRGRVFYSLYLRRSRRG